MLKNLGSRIRTLRKTKGLTLVEIAEKTGVAQATLSRIETGTMVGTIESHEKIAEVLGVGLSELYTGVDRRYDEISHLTQDSERKVSHHGKNVQMELLTSESSKKKITPLLLTLQSGAKTSSERNERGVEKFLYLLEGELQIEIDKETYTLKQGETLYFDASLSHQYSNPSKKSSRLLITVSPSRI